MKVSLIFSFLALALSGVAVVGMLLDSAARAPRTEGEVVPVSPAVDAELLAEVQALRERLAAVELQPAPVSQRIPVTEGFVTKEDFAAFQDEVREALEGSALASTLQVPAFKEQLADTMEQIQRDEAVAKTDASYRKRVESLDDRMAKLGDILGLDRRQASRLRSELLAKYERDADLTRRWQLGEDAEVLGEVKATNHRVHQEELSAILTLEQLARYQDLGARDGGSK